MVNRTAISVGFIAGVGGSAMAEVFCSDTPLAVFKVELPTAPPPGFTQSFLGPSAITNVCFRQGQFVLFSKRPVITHAVPGWAQGTVWSFEEVSLPENSRVVQLRVPSAYGGFGGDLLAGAILASQRDPGAIFLVDGDQDVAAILSSIHPRFRNQASTEFCVRRLEHPRPVKPMTDFEEDDFALVRSLLPTGSGRRSIVLELEGAPLVANLTGVHVLPLAQVQLRSLPWTFDNTHALIMPFQAPPGVLAFLRTLTKVIIVRPAGFPCHSELERMIGRSGLAAVIVNATLLDGKQCDASCECIATARYRVEAEDITAAIG
jgi:hypothetical protein